MFGVTVPQNPVEGASGSDILTGWIVLTRPYFKPWPVGNSSEPAH